MYSACHVNFIISISCNTDRWPVVLHLKKNGQKNKTAVLTSNCVRGLGDAYNSNQTEIYFGIYMEKLLSLVALSCAYLKTQIPIFLWSSSVTFITHRLKLLLGCLGQFREVQATQRQRHRHKNKRMLAACGQRKMRREEKRGGWMYGWMDEVWRKEWDCQKRWGGTGVFFT